MCVYALCSGSLDWITGPCLSDIVSLFTRLITTFVSPVLLTLNTVTNTIINRRNKHPGRDFLSFLFEGHQFPQKLTFARTQGRELAAECVTGGWHCHVANELDIVKTANELLLLRYKQQGQRL